MLLMIVAEKIDQVLFIIACFQVDFEKCRIYEFDSMKDFITVGNLILI